ncbi:MULTISPECIES: SRPBCC family protein [Streptomyces]|uniref:Polyketide cyclase n=1 Tax=Streptomyces venezuelae TaxID=54571 RepID=A0A5P2B191_STRVZ|nr:SRPBCC family protein [Streptomyces venezuelae]QES24213.1 polyketide cyclase [Streptomyces venezuelae]
MITVERTILLPLPLEKAFSYLEDFERTEEWDPGTVRCVRVDRGAVRPGATWHNTSRFRGRTTELSYRLEVREPARLVFVGANSSVVAKDEMLFGAPSAEATLLTYRASFRFKGLARLAERFLRAEFERLADDVTERLPSALAQHAR